MYRTKTEQQQARELINALIKNDASELSPLGRGLVSALLGEPARELRLRREVLVNAAMSRSVSYRVNGATKTWKVEDRQASALTRAADLITKRIDDLESCLARRLSAAGKRERANLASSLSSQMREITFTEPDHEPVTTTGQDERPKVGGVYTSQRGKVEAVVHAVRDQKAGEPVVFYSVTSLEVPDGVTIEHPLSVWRSLGWTSQDDREAFIAARLIEGARELGAADGKAGPNEYNAYDMGHEDDIFAAVCEGASLDPDAVDVVISYAVVDAYQDAYVSASQAAQGS